MSWVAPAVESFRAVAERDAEGSEVRGVLGALLTEELLPVEIVAVRLIWAARDVRHEREKRT